ncbi:MAG: SGNH/GDSL hydrolase family protein [Chloroflexi bacterium]|nr:SGNH/GDSL hydrolase family protein [Chloroflexota bacterium]
MLRLTLPLLLALVMLVALTPVPAGAEQADSLVYLALGDSVPSGTDTADGVGYPFRLGQRIANASGGTVRLFNRARSGEQSSGVLDAQLGDLTDLSPQLVTLTVGANDFLTPTIECVASTLDDRSDTICSASDLPGAVPRFEGNLRAILGRVTSETTATVVVTTYYNPFPRGSRCAPGLTDLALRGLNGSIVLAARAFPDRVIVADLEAVFRGHEGREPAGWFSANPLHLACSDIHPSPSGHEAIADAIWSTLAPPLARTAPAAAAN